MYVLISTGSVSRHGSASKKLWVFTILKVEMFKWIEAMEFYVLFTHHGTSVYNKWKSKN